MKSILTILTILIVLNASGQSLKVEWTNVAELYDTLTYELKPGPHKVIVKKIVNRKSSYDTINIQIMGDSSEYAVNYMPKCFAGNDTTFTVGKTGILKGSGADIDGTISKWYWKKVSGPAKGRISYSSRQNTPLMDNVAGKYVYRLTITDNNGGTASDEVIVTFK